MARLPWSPNKDQNKSNSKLKEVEERVTKLDKRVERIEKQLLVTTRRESR